MPDPALFALTWRAARRGLLASPLVVAAGLAFPALVVWTGLRDSYGTAAKLFFFMLPHLFLIGCQDAVRAEVESGALESVLFLGGRFRGYLGLKSILVAAAVSAYAVLLFGLMAVWGAAAGGFEAVFVLRFGLALLAGLYYAAIAGVLSHILRGGANVLVPLLAQAGAVIALIMSTTARTGLLDYAAAGRFPGPGAALRFGGLVAVLPNIVVSGRLPVFAAEVLAGLGLAVLVRGRLIRALELGK